MNLIDEAIRIRTGETGAEAISGATASDVAIAVSFAMAIANIDTTGAMLMGGEAATLCSLYRRVDAESDEHDPIFLASWCFPVLYCEQGIPDIDPVLSATVNRIRAMSAEEHDRLRDRDLRGLPNGTVVPTAARQQHRCRR
mgnify:CR=1 FL=1